MIILKGLRHLPQTLILCGFSGLFEKIYDYTMKVFPNPDKTVGEWIQIRKRDGSPQDKVVALPVKDPYHIIRNIILLIELLED